MKRLLLLFVLFNLFLSGCSSFGEWLNAPVSFYYIYEDYRQDMESVIASEIREASGHREDLAYLLALYSLGPVNEELVSPFPPNTVIIPIEHSGSSMVLSLSENVLELTDVEYTLASSCLALTCMDITNVENVTVVCEEKSITIEKDNLLLHHDIMSKQQEE